MTIERLHLVDGTYELFRAHFTRGPRRTDVDGTEVTATVGLLRRLTSLLDDDDEAVTHLAVAFDRPIESFRNRLFEGYKDGSDVDPELAAQFEPAERAVASLGVAVWSMDEYEADDALATAAVRFAGEVGQVRILTPDKDLAQVVDGDRVIQVDQVRDRVMDAAGVEQRLGVPPDAVVDLLALEGDSADGIPGVPGIGRTTATKLLQRYGSIDDIPADAADWDVPVRGAERIADALRVHADGLALWRRLARLVTDVDLGGVTLPDLRWAGPTDRFRTEAGRLGSRTLSEWTPGRARA